MLMIISHVQVKNVEYGKGKAELVRREEEKRYEK